MGFFSSIAKSVSTGMNNAAEKNMLMLWEKMRRLERNRLVEIYETSDKSTVKMFAHILLCRFSDPSYEISNTNEVLDKIKRFRKSNSFLMGEGKEWQEIRESVKKMESRGYLE